MAPASLVDRSKRSVFFIIEWVKKVKVNGNNEARRMKYLSPVGYLMGKFCVGNTMKVLFAEW
jgi:hypothetical protein